MYLKWNLHRNAYVCATVLIIRHSVWKY